jgi:AcrR family transcriptional regulator
MHTGARRGERLREHILWIAKDVFLELGFERTSMDVIASRAGTSKRSLYAHFESKEKLFLAVIELVRGLFLARLKQPADYSDRTSEALVVFCARYLMALLYEPAIQMMRVSTAEADRFPEQAMQYFDVLFTQAHSRLSEYLKTTFKISSRSSEEAANKLLGQILYPRLSRALFGVDTLAKEFGQDVLPAEFDLKPIRKAVAELVERMQKR